MPIYLYSIDDVSTFSLSRLIRMYLLTSYTYEQQGQSVVADETFDHICQLLAERTPQEIVDGDPHGSFIHYELLSAGSGFSLDFTDFPGRIIGGATAALEKFEELNRSS